MGCPEWACSVCDKKFVHPTRQKLGLAKKMHLLKAHGIRNDWEYLAAQGRRKQKNE